MNFETRSESALSWLRNGWVLRRQNFSLDWCKQADVGLPKPDLVVFLQLQLPEAAARGEFGRERYESSPFQQRALQRFQQLLGDSSLPWKVGAVPGPSWGRRFLVLGLVQDVGQCPDAGPGQGCAGSGSRAAGPRGGPCAEPAVQRAPVPCWTSAVQGQRPEHRVRGGQAAALWLPCNRLERGASQPLHVDSRRQAARTRHSCHLPALRPRSLAPAHLRARAPAPRPILPARARLARPLVSLCWPCPRHLGRFRGLGSWLWHLVLLPRPPAVPPRCPALGGAGLWPGPGLLWVQVRSTPLTFPFVSCVLRGVEGRACLSPDGGCSAVPQIPVTSLLAASISS